MPQPVGGGEKKEKKVRKKAKKRKKNRDSFGPKEGFHQNNSYERLKKRGDDT